MESDIPQSRSHEEAHVGMADHSLNLVRGIVSHVVSLLSLFWVELDEYRRRRMRCYALLAVGMLLLFFSYAALWVTLVMWAGPRWGYALCTLVVFAVHAVAGGVMLVAAFRVKPGALAPHTVNELKEDYACLKMAIGKKEKS